MSFRRPKGGKISVALIDVIEIFRFALNDMIVYNRLYED